MLKEKETYQKKGKEVCIGLTDVNALDRIIKETLESIEQSKIKIYDIAENARLEMNRVTEELAGVKNEVLDVIKLVDNLVTKEKKARISLIEVSKDFQKYTEKDIKDAYDEAYRLQVELIKQREREKLLRYRRDHLEVSLRRLQSMVQRAEKLVSQVGVVLNFLGSGLQDLTSKLGELHQAQQMALSIIRAQEEERKRVAREIHDGPAQSMANIVMRAEFCLKLLDINPAKVREELISLQQLVRLSLTDVRKIIFDLRPMVLDDLGLVPAIKRYLSDYSNQDNTLIEFHSFGQQSRFDTSIEVALFRIIQEIVSNIRKHSMARNAMIKMEVFNDKLTIFVKDDGIGFNFEEVMSDRENRGYGLVGMRERVQLLKGEIQITTAPGKGTTIRITVPLYNM